MTSDAKVGLLLGLFFIFAIAFIINGLPSLREAENNNELTTNMVSLQNNPAGIAAKERKVCEVIKQTEPVNRRPLVKVQPSSTDNQNVRFTTPLPKSGAVVKDTDKTRPVAHIRSLPMAEGDGIGRTGADKTNRAKIYVVREGDTLADIAERFYGPIEGNKRINVNRIFQVNQRVLSSPDKIYERQRLIIPPLMASATRKNKSGSALDSPILEKVESIGKRHLPNGNRLTKRSRRHIVREGDSLWRIAAKYLGNGSRYDEIAKLNADVIDDEDNLAAGMRLKLPAQ